MRALTGFLRRVLAIAVALCAGVAAQPVMARPGVRPVALHPRFSRAGTAAYVETDGRYAFLAQPYSADGPVGTVRDERTGQRVTISMRQYGNVCVNGGSTNPGFAGPWLLIGGCASPNNPVTVELYRLASATTQTFRFDVRFCALTAAECHVGPVGADWLEVTESCYHCATQYAFANLNTGRIRRAPRTTPHTVLDLNSPTLTRRLCPPLTVGPANTLSSYGPFVVLGNTNSAAPSYLERCGTTLRLKLPAAAVIFGNSHELLWYTNSNHLGGLTLPGLERFVVQIPEMLYRAGTGYALSSRHLYAFDNKRMLWTAAPPLPPRTS